VPYVHNFGALTTLRLHKDTSQFDVIIPSCPDWQLLGYLRKGSQDQQSVYKNSAIAKMADPDGIDSSIYFRQPWNPAASHWSLLGPSSVGTWGQQWIYNMETQVAAAARTGSSNTDNNCFSPGSLIWQCFSFAEFYYKFSPHCQLQQLNQSVFLAEWNEQLQPSVTWTKQDLKVWFCCSLTLTERQALGTFWINSHLPRLVVWN